MDEKDQIIARQQLIIDQQNQLIASLKEEIVVLKNEIQNLKELLNRNSKNSSLPPSQDKSKPNKPKNPNKNNRYGHKGFCRKMVPEEDVTSIINLRPEKCTGCGNSNFIQPKLKEVRQTVEIPIIKPIVTEYRSYSCKCTDCGKEVKATFPIETRKVFGARLRSIGALLTGKFKISKRGVKELLKEVLGITTCIGSVSNFEAETAVILEAGWNNAKEALQKSETIYADETQWKTKGKKQWLWQGSDKKRVVFQIDPSRGKKAAAKLIGKDCFANLVTDRWRAYSTLGLHQYCWAHLKRDFKKVEERPGLVSIIGELLGSLCSYLFKLDKEKNNGKLTENEFAESARNLRVEFNYLFNLGVRTDCKEGKLGKTGRFCERILSEEDNLWHFIDEPTIDLTNNLSERNIRPAVIMRKITFGTQSERGNRFVERILTLVETFKIQQRNVYEYLSTSFDSYLKMTPITPFA